MDSPPSSHRRWYSKPVENLDDYPHHHHRREYETTHVENLDDYLHHQHTRDCESTTQKIVNNFSKYLLFQQSITEDIAEKTARRICNEVLHETVRDLDQMDRTMDSIVVILKENMHKEQHTRNFVKQLIHDVDYLLRLNGLHNQREPFDDSDSEDDSSKDQFIGPDGWT